MIITSPQIVRTRGRASFCTSKNLFGVTRLPPLERSVLSYLGLVVLLVASKEVPIAKDSHTCRQSIAD